MLFSLRQEPPKGFGHTPPVAATARADVRTAWRSLRPTDRVEGKSGIYSGVS